MSGEFRKKLESGEIIVFDGAMGTMLAARGIEPGLAANVIAPESVLAVHCAYREAGADVLITNTFGVNSQMRADAETRKALSNQCRAAYDHAREAAAGGGFVAGDMGPTGVLLVPYGTAKLSEMNAVFKGAANLLAKYGVDLFIVETMSDGSEMMLAVNACREAARKANRDIPIAASMAFDPSRQGGFRTNMGVSPSAAAEAMIAAGADIIGANCGSVTPEQMAEIVREFRSVTKQHPILAQPNAGVPELQAGQTVFRLAPEAFAAGMLKVRAAGAQLLGGCCGTTPEHIRCLRQAL
jgi:5-methyltetrahydrofolate--homocysteine methyltransferase